MYKEVSAALPRLATGVGGLQWDDVKPRLAQHWAISPFRCSCTRRIKPGTRQPKTCKMCRSAALVHQGTRPYARSHSAAISRSFAFWILLPLALGVKGNASTGST